ncbi:MAG: response regulator [Gemmatimonadota bacterium]
MNPQREGSAGRVLVVEDEPSIRLFYERFFVPRGFHVRAVARAEEAREIILAEEEYDVILLDVQMPGIGGRGLWRFIGENRAEYQGRTIFITGDILGPKTRELLDRAGCPYLFKPFDNDQLLEHVKKIVETVRRSREQGGLGCA